jgi:hypothetical protein
MQRLIDLGIESERIRIAVAAPNDIAATTGPDRTGAEKPIVEVFLLDEIPTTPIKQANLQRTSNSTLPH